MMGFSSHCSRCGKKIKDDETPYCVNCSNKILEEMNINIIGIRRNNDGGIETVEPDDDEFGRLLKRFILVMYKKERDRKLSELN